LAVARQGTVNGLFPARSPLDGRRRVYVRSVNPGSARPRYSARVRTSTPSASGDEAE